MKLTPQVIQVYPTPDPNSVLPILPATIRFFRLTHDGFEIAYIDSIGTPRVALIQGNGLDRLWQDLIFNRLHAFRVGLLAPYIGVTVIRPKERNLALPRVHLLSEPEKCRADCFTIENGHVRDLWSSDSLVAFAIHRTRPELLLQFPGMAYICVPSEGQFHAVRDQILNNNLVTHVCPLWTVAGASWRPAAFTGKFYHFQSIRVLERDISQTGDWDVRVQGPAAGNHGMTRPGVGMDI